MLPRGFWPEGASACGLLSLPHAAKCLLTTLAQERFSGMFLLPMVQTDRSSGQRMLSWDNNMSPLPGTGGQRHQSWENTDNPPHHLTENVTKWLPHDDIIKDEAAREIKSQKSLAVL